MATIIQRRRKNGSIAYRAEVRTMREGKLIFKQTRTFDDKRRAQTWARELEYALEQPGILERARLAEYTVGYLIEQYLRTVDAIKPIARTRKTVLRAVQKTPFAELLAAELQAKDLIDYCQARRAEGAGPATILIDYGSLKAVFDSAKPVLGIPVPATVFQEARPQLVRLGLIAKGKTRARRPTEDELDRLLAHSRLRLQHHSSFIPLADIVEFAVYTCLRQGEICRILWDDVDEKRRTVLVRDRKNPTEKAGNDQEIPLLGPAWDIVQRQPWICDRIFPFDEKSVSSAFTRVCQQLGITNLHFHDLRREGASRLFEMGYTVAEVATVTGHKDLHILWNVYTKINPETLHAKYNQRLTQIQR